MTLPPVCLLAGGLGTRLGALGEKTPKALIEVAGEPFINHQLRLLAACGVTRVVCCVGHLGELIERHVGAEAFGITVVYSYDSPGLDGTLGAIRRAVPLLGPRFLYLYGDTYLRVDYAAASNAWDKSGLPALMTVLANGGRWGASNADFDGTLVTSYDKLHPSATMSYIDYGLGGLTAGALAIANEDESDLASLHARLASRGLLFGYEATNRFYEIGTPAALQETDRFLSELGKRKEP